jgi:transcriptional regulator with XRE-family HTH domain
MPGVHVGRRIREARDAMDLSQHELAARVGVSQRAISYVEKQAWVKQATLEKYGTALDRPLAYFLRPYGGETVEAGLTRQETIQQAFAVVCRDPEFGFGERPGEDLSLDAKRDIVRLYERCKGVSLLPPELA